MHRITHYLTLTDLVHEFAEEEAIRSGREKPYANSMLATSAYQARRELLELTKVKLEAFLMQTVRQFVKSGKYPNLEIMYSFSREAGGKDNPLTSGIVFYSSERLADNELKRFAQGLASLENKLSKHNIKK